MKDNRNKSGSRTGSGIEIFGDFQMQEAAYQKKTEILFDLDLHGTAKVRIYFFPPKYLLVSVFSGCNSLRLRMFLSRQTTYHESEDGQKIRCYFCISSV